MNFKSPNTNKSLSRLHTVLPLIGILTLILLVDNYALTPFFKKSEPFNDVEIRFSPIRDNNISNYAVVDDENQLVFAASTPEDFNLGLEFTVPARLTVNIEPVYRDSGCSSGGINKAKISLQGDTIQHTFPLIHTQNNKVELAVYKDQLINVSVSNRDYPDCGKAIINFTKHNNKTLATISFGLTWLCIFMMCLSIRTSTLIALLGTTFNALLIWAETTFKELSLLSILASIGLSLGFTGTLLLFNALPIASKILAVLFSLCVALALLYPISFISHEQIFFAPLNDESIHAILQSYLAQVVEFWMQFVGLSNTLIGLIGILLISLICIRFNNFKSRKFLTGSIGLLFLCVALMMVSQQWQHNKTLALIYQSIKVYRFEVASFLSVQAKRQHANIEAKQDPLFTDNTTVFVIGESVNRSHMSAYGYVRETTPFIDKRIADGNVIKFSNVFSNHTHSNPTISYLLTQANQYNNTKWIESPSILNITNTVSIKSTWFTNHRLLGGWSNYITSIARDANVVKTINNKVGAGNRASRDDGDLLPLWRDALQETPNQASFLHFYNSHLDYCGRYPESANKFTTKVTRAYFGEWVDNRKATSESVNCYDNSIFYTDQLLEEIIQDLDNKERPSILVYIPDHADDVLQARFHNAVLFTFAMTTVPLFIWANDEWRQQHPELWQNLLNNKDTPFTNDLMFESMAGLLGISSASINRSYDFSSAEFTEQKPLKTIHGRRIISSPINWRYWQTTNAQSLIEQGYKLGATHIDSVAKAKIALDIGFDLLQINAIYSDTDGFQLTDKNNNLIGIDLDVLLNEVDQKALTTVLVSLGNKSSFSEHDLNRALNRVTSAYSTEIMLDNNTNTLSTLDLGARTLLRQQKVTTHNKSDVLMLNLTTQFDVIKEEITIN